MINAGAVMFHGVTDDTLARAAVLLGDPDAGRRLRAGRWRPTSGSVRNGGGGDWLPTRCRTRQYRVVPCSATCTR